MKKIINILKRTSALKKVLPEKPIIAFCKMKSIRNYIVRTDIKETNDKKKLNKWHHTTHAEKRVT